MDIGISAIDIVVDDLQVTVDISIFNIDRDDDAREVTLRIDDPPQLVYQSASTDGEEGARADCSATMLPPAVIECVYDVLPAGQSRTISLLFVRTQQGTVNERVQLSHALPDCDPSDNDGVIYIPADTRIPGAVPPPLPDLTPGPAMGTLDDCSAGVGMEPGPGAGGTDGGGTDPGPGAGGTDGGTFEPTVNDFPIDDPIPRPGDGPAPAFPTEPDPPIVVDPPPPQLPEEDPNPPPTPIEAATGVVDLPLILLILTSLVVKRLRRRGEGHRPATSHRVEA